MSKLGMCPFCGVDLKASGKNFYVHPAVGCLLDEMLLLNDKEPIKRWNTRKPLERIVEELEEELRLADEEKRRCVAENMFQFDSAKGYANGIYNAMEIVKEEGGMNEKV